MQRNFLFLIFYFPFAQNFLFSVDYLKAYIGSQGNDHVDTAGRYELQTSTLNEPCPADDFCQQGWFCKTDIVCFSNAKTNGNLGKNSAKYLSHKPPVLS